MNDKELTKLILSNEIHFLGLFCYKDIKDNYIRYFDDGLRDMYDLNFTKLYGEMNDDIFDELYKYKLDRNEPHFQVCSHSKISYLKDKGFDEGCTVTMAATSLKVNPIKIKGIEFKNSKDHPEIINNVLDLELKYYGELWGNDFGGRNIYHHFAKMNQVDNYYYLACYHNNKIISHCYAFYSDGVVLLDGLIVKEKYRHLNIASNMIFHIKNTYNCPIYLHAYEEEDAKDMYTKIGFKIMYRQYDYLLLDKKDQK